MTRPKSAALLMGPPSVFVSELHVPSAVLVTPSIVQSHDVPTATSQVGAQCQMIASILQTLRLMP